MAQQSNTSLSKNKNKRDRILLVDSEGTVVTTSDLPEKVPVLPAFHRPIFPGILSPISVDNQTSQWLREQISEDKMIAVVMVKPHKLKENQDMLVHASQLYRLGTLAYVLNWVELPDQSCQFMLSTLQRIKIERYQRKQKHYQADISYFEDEKIKLTEELKAGAAAIVSTLKELIPQNPTFSQEMFHLLNQVDINDPVMLADLAASMTNAKSEDLQKILETENLEQRIENTLLLLREEYDLSLLKEQISQKIDERVSKQQRDFFLREQLREIQQELGLEQDRKSLELKKFRERFDNLDLNEEAKKRVDEEMQRYAMLDEQSPELQVVHQYLDCIASLPWKHYSRDRLGLTRAERILNQDHYGMQKVKNRILEFIGVSKLKKSTKGAILCFVGPPGVGKTSLGRSVARALGREFYRFSVGGLTDESELKGHRRTYIGAMPGRFIQALKSVKTGNPVILLDELDKMGQSYRGDPLSVLLEVLDPEQNREFMDHYLDIQYDLSNVLFIATANVLDTIPPALKDRLEIIPLSGYINEEKIQIGTKYLIPKVLDESGLKQEQFRLHRKTLEKLIQEFTRETGVRGLEKQLKALSRAVALKVARGKTETISLNPGDLESMLGPAPFPEEAFKASGHPGVVQGLAWTPSGGTILNIEAIALQGGKAELKLTGQLGEVMKESSIIAHSLIRSILSKQKKNKVLLDHPVHLHVPEGATPKDGPSAGISMATAMHSLALKKCVKRELAMTGELTLTGQVLPVGGIREKIVGSRLAGMKQIIMPRANKPQYDELPDYLKKDQQIFFVEHYDEVRRIALEH
ncbi:MAG: endopeptidase La [SAR324 cluster bacterium]|nr:endopeptidase La [SAR324 cluster bacterium]|tara:strand:- start:2274 stop:4700 length:2427 start_codon:yes stop_codon:yes gene_type:complete